MPPPATTGRLTGIATRPARRAPMVEADEAQVTAGAGLTGDHKGAKFPGRGVTLLAAEDWATALAQLEAAAEPDLFGLPPPSPVWTARRANLLVVGLRLPRARGAVLAIGEVRLEVTAQTYPCRRMEDVRAGLMKALAPEWRGGVSCRVLMGARIRLGDEVRLISSPPERVVRLPG